MVNTLIHALIRFNRDKLDKPLLHVPYSCLIHIPTCLCSHGIQVSKGHSQCHALTLCKVQGKWCWRHVPLATAVKVFPQIVSRKWPKKKEPANKTLVLIFWDFLNKTRKEWCGKWSHLNAIKIIGRRMISKLLNLNNFVGVGLGTSVINIDCRANRSSTKSHWWTAAWLPLQWWRKWHQTLSLWLWSTRGDIPTFTGMMILHDSFHCLRGFLDAWNVFQPWHFFHYEPLFAIIAWAQHRRISWASFMKAVSQRFLIPKAPLITIFPTLWWNMLP